MTWLGLLVAALLSSISHFGARLAPQPTMTVTAPPVAASPDPQSSIEVIYK